MPKTAPKKQPNFRYYVEAILRRRVHPQFFLHQDTEDLLQNLMIAVLRELCGHAVAMMRHNRANTLTARDVQFATRVFFVHDLAERAVEAGNRAVIRFTTFVPSLEGARKNNAEKAGLVIPPARVHAVLDSCVDKKSKETKRIRISSLAPVFLAGVLEFLMHELFRNIYADEKTCKHLLVEDVDRFFKKKNAITKSLCRLEWR